MHSAPSRIIPMYPEEGALHEIGDACGGKRVKNRATLISSQFPALVHGPCGDGAGGHALCEKALADLVQLVRSSAAPERDRHHHD
jgi:hypothetical protein